MEDELFVPFSFDETHQFHQGFQTNRFEEKKCLNVPGTVLEQSTPFFGEDNLKINGLKTLTEGFAPDSKENITSNNSVISDESTVCAMNPFNNSNLVNCEKKLLESSSDQEKKFELQRGPIGSEQLLQLSKKLNILNDTLSTPPSELRQQISMLRMEVNEAYEFHDLEFQIFKEEKKEGPESYAQLIEKYSTLLELYTSLKNEYEEYRRDQEKIRNELQSKTVDCLQSLCSQIETSDNSLNSEDFLSFNTDLKCSTMIDNFTEKEATLLHDVTIQTKDPLSNTDIFNTPKLTPLKSVNKFISQNLIKKGDYYDSKLNVKFMEVETALSEKAKELEKLEQRLFKNEDLSGLLQNEFERISVTIVKENETLKENLLNKTEQLDMLTQKLLTEIISLNPGLMDSLADVPGTKLLPVLIETIMERCKNIEDKLVMKFSIEKSHLEIKINDLEEENKKLNEEISSQVSALQELKMSYEKQLLEIENMILTRDEEIRILKAHDFTMKQMQEDFARAKDEVTRLEAQLSLSDSLKTEMENKCLVLEKTAGSLRLELGKIKEFCGATENENNNLMERLSQITTENGDLQQVCEKLKQQVSVNEGIISSQDEELQNLKNRDIKQMKALTQAEENVLKVKAELFTTESEKLNFEKRCFELENTVSTLQNLIITKDNILRDLENFKSSCESEGESMRQQIKEKEVTISDLRVELDTLKHMYSLEVKKTESLNKEINSQVSKFAKLEESYKDIEKKLLNAEANIQKQDEEILILQSHEINFNKLQDDLASAKEIIERLRATLLLAEDDKKKLEHQCQALKEKCDSPCQNLERIKSGCTNLEIENENCIKLIHQKNTEFEFESLFEILKEGLEKLKLSPVEDFSKIMKKAIAVVKKLQSRAVELKEENEKLDEECDSYARVIKDLKKEAAVEWKKNNEKMQAFEEKILGLTEMKNDLEREKKELLGKITKLEDEFQRLKANVTPEGRNGGHGMDLKNVNELKRTILVKELKLLELQDIEAQNNSYKTQIEYLKNALDRERKKINEEREKNKKLQNDLNEATQNQKTENKKFDENQILEELRMRGSISGGIVGEIVDKEKMRKLSKDVGVLKEICRARYAEIKRLEAENATLKNFTSKNSNQMDSPLRSRGCNTRSKSKVVEKWKTEMAGKENKAV